MYFYCYVYLFLLCVYVYSSCQLALFGYLSCKANAMVKPAKTGHGPQSSKLLCCCYMYVLFVSCRSVYCLFVNVYCATATGWLPNCSEQIYHVIALHYPRIAHLHLYSFISTQPWSPGLAGTRAQSCDRCGSGTLHPGQILGGSLPLLSPLDVPTLAARCLRPQWRERS